MITRLMLTSYTNWLAAIGGLIFLSFCFGLLPEAPVTDRAGTTILMATVGSWILGIAGTIGMLIGVFSSTSEINDHGRQIGSLRLKDTAIENSEKYLTNVKDNYNTLKESLQATLKDLPSSMLNSDNPVSSLVEGLMREVSSAEGKVLNERQEKARIQAKIESRKIGPYGWIVELYGDK